MKAIHQSRVTVLLVIPLARIGRVLCRCRWAGLVTAVLFGGVASDAAEISLKFGLYSSKKPTEMVEQYRPLLSCMETQLTQRLNTPVTIHTRVVKTYEEGIQAIVDGSFDFTQIGPVSYVEAREKNPAIEILAIESARGRKTVNGIICVASTSPIRALADIKGRSFAFGDQFSTTGRYNSQLYLLQHGITAKALSRYDYLERHDRVGLAVAAGEFDAGALNERTFKKLNANGTQLRALAEFPIVGRPWVARSGLPSHVRDGLRQVLLELKDTRALAALGEEGLIFLPGMDGDFVSTRTAVQMNDQFFK